MEEAIWLLAPIAVAVLAYLLDVRQARRYELEADSIKDRMRGLELAHVSGNADKDLKIALLDKSVEHHDGRLTALENTESGLPKDDGDKMRARIDNLDYNVTSLAIGHKDLVNKVAGLQAEAVEE